MARVELQNVTKRFPNGAVAVDGVSLAVEDKEFVVLVGPSGCGKSTTLRLIAGLESPDGGTIRIGDRVVNDVAPRDRDVAMVFQSYALYPHMTVEGNLSFALRLRMLPPFWTRPFRRAQAKRVAEDIRRRVDRVADMLGIAPLLRRLPRELSGGQRQRVALGRAMVREPAAFLFDEPLSNLDARLRVTTRAELKRLHQRLRTTTVYVTHDQEEAMTLGDRIVVMKDGKIQQSDPALQTYHQPVNRFVAGFIGMPPMNFFPGVLQGSGQDLAFDERRCETPVTNLRDPAAEGAESAGQLTAATKGFTLGLSRLRSQVRERLASRVGSSVVLGIRPEHLSLRPIASEDGSIASQPLEMALSVVEPLGSELDLYLRSASNDSVVARVEAEAGEGRSVPQVGSVVRVHVDLRRVHLFEPGEAGLNLSLENVSMQTASTGQSVADETSHATA